VKLGMKIEGLAGLEEALVELEQFTGRTTSGKNAVQRGMRKALGSIEARAKQLVPVDTGRLRETITTKKARARRGAGGRYLRESGIEMLTGPTGREEGGIAAYKEFGTINEGATPFMRPAADAGADQVIAEVASLLRDEITKTADRARKRAARKG
jgi:HK97 gp10 family phage protein